MKMTRNRVLTIVAVFMGLNLALLIYFFQDSSIYTKISHLCGMIVGLIIIYDRMKQ
jgi:hypothetical protein